jgi:hypothetical protein
MSLVAFVRRRPYTVVAVLILVCLLGIGVSLRTFRLSVLCGPTTA